MDIHRTVEDDSPLASLSRAELHACIGGIQWPLPLIIPPLPPTANTIKVTPANGPISLSDFDTFNGPLVNVIK